MFQIRDLAQMHVKDLADLPRYEETFDNRVRSHFRANPFALSIRMNCSDIALSILQKIAPKYREAKWHMFLSDYPTVEIKVLREDYIDVYKEELTKNSDPAEHARAVKV